MKKNNIIAIATVFLIFVSVTLKAQEHKSFYDFKVIDINGDEFNLNQLNGKKVLVVNTASKCGFTPQYEDLEDLFKQYGGDNFTIIGFPANNFLHQESGSNEEIKSFCQKNYGVSFPMMAKISVKGSDMAPIYKWLTQKNKNGVMDSDVKWNFQKYMIDENGNLVDMVAPKVSPKNEKILNWIKSK